MKICSSEDFLKLPCSGFLCVTGSFAFLFIECFGCKYQSTSSLVEFAYYVPFVVIFQFGWAAVQISHLALIPQLSTCQHERATLNAIRFVPNALRIGGLLNFLFRYAFTVVANIVVFGLVYIFVGLVDASRKGVTHEDGISFSVSGFTISCVVRLLY